MMKKKLFKNNKISLLLFEIIYRCIYFLLFFPLLIKIFEYVLEKSNYSYITNNNFILILKNPIIIITLLIVFFILAFSTFLEINCIIVSITHSQLHKKISVTEIFFLGLVNFKKMLKSKFFLSVAFSILLLPIVNFSSIFYVLYKYELIQYLLKNIFVNHGYLNLIFSFSIIAIFFELICLYIFPKFVSDQKFKIKKNLFKNLFFLLITNLITILILALLVLIVGVFSTIYVKFKYDNSIAYSQLMIYGDRISYFIFFVSGIISLIFNIIIMYKIYYLQKIKSEDKKIFKDDIMQPLYKMKTFTKIVVSFIFVSISIIESYVVFDILINGSTVLDKFFQNTVITAHRGGANFVPENTLKAVEYAVNVSSDFVEIDVQPTKDGKIILLHDLDLKRTTGFSGKAYKLNYEDIRRLDPSYYYKGKYQNLYIPTLEEVIDLYKDKIKFNIEIKYDKKYNEKFVDDIVNYLTENNLENRCVISCTNYGYIKRVKELNPKIKTGYILRVVLGNVRGMEDVDFLSLSHRYLNINTVNMIQYYGKEVHVWTVNTKSDINRVKTMGVNNLITDNPILCRELISENTVFKNFNEIFKSFLIRIY